MKNLFIAFTIFFTTSLIAQTHQIIKHDGGTIDINFIKTENNLVYYTLPKSVQEKTISQYAVAQLNEKSKSDSEIISKKIQLNGKSDYKKVVVLKKHQTIGLKESGMITSFYGGTKGESPLSFSDNGEKRLKENAALKGSQFIVILSNKPKDLKAAIYTY
ncbi:hypothetical protein QLS91_06910 [Flavobacterium sp. LB2P84]|jgi:hypothetical protein|uniref:Uncharacterized protein n=1 Tax=Flavobacterium yafengii TaxID=3041253 RepID=A0AAW6TMA7_9FLAO|nr:hypothetical protein [Flavobacterium yafengii]MDI5897363.1 hypothetical protein [Flavobacterium yafengii]MDI5949599.1 hypothetical protein [Flavobacterium yafengii]MDI6032800.1 hypothetical protein [Flavobacterium yafengii]MDI6045921.1 hypothetical protein [Flavobacterium yafengii]